MTKNDWDVIVIGGGGAGLCAAVTAREAGQEVLLLSKGPIGRGCATAYSGGLFSVAVEGMTVEEHRKRSLECGRYLNERHLLNVLVEEAPARWAREQPASKGEIAPGDATRNKIRNWTANTGGALPGDLWQRLNEVVDRRLGPLRTGTGIEQGLIELERLEEQLPRMRFERESDLRKALEMENLCLTARLVARSALARRESRGQHFREDHPKQDDAWLRHVVIRRGAQGPLLELKDVTQRETNHQKV